jgi:hypothetical protein
MVLESCGFNREIKTLKAIMNNLHTSKSCPLGLALAHLTNPFAIGPVVRVCKLEADKKLNLGRYPISSSTCEPTKLIQQKSD